MKQLRMLLKKGKQVNIMFKTATNLQLSLGHNLYHVMILILCIFCTSSIYGDYQVTDLGGNYVYGMGINNNNVVVGYIKPSGNIQNAYAFKWTKDTGVQSIGGYIAYSINDNGVIAGENMIIKGYDNYYYGAIWENGVMTTFTDRQDVRSINNNGQCTGLISAQPYIPGPYRPYRDDDIHTPGFITLVNPNPTQWVGQGMDLNNKGEVVASFGRDGVFYNSDGSYTILNDRGSYSYPYSINDNGQIVGRSMQPHSDISTLRAVYWGSPSNNMIYMGRLGSGYGYARSINNQGIAVGYDSGKAFVWSLQMGMKDLNTLIDPDLGITLTNAMSINDNGNILAWGTNSLNEEHTYLLVVPEPSTMFLILIGISIIRAKHRKTSI